MFGFVPVKLMLISFLSFLSTSTITPDTYIGKWSIEGGSIIEIYSEGSHFFGKIHKRTTYPTSNLNGLDNKNPVTALRNRQLLGMIILDKLSFDQGVLSGGTIYNADSGKTYTVKVWIDPENTNKCYIRAYKSFLFRTFEAVRLEE